MITAARDERPALIVLDSMLPEVDGLRCARSCAADRTAMIPILMLTAKASGEDGPRIGAGTGLTTT